MAQSLENRFLIAMPALAGDCFDHAVVYVYEHSETGAMGIIINKPMQISVSGILEHLELDSENPELDALPVMMGGPIDQSQGFILHQDSNDLFLSASKELLLNIAQNDGPENYIITLGYSSWNNGQLEQEICDNYWLVIDADPQLIFDTPVDKRWEQAVASLGVSIHQISEHTGHA